MFIKSTCNVLLFTFLLCYTSSATLYKGDKCSLTDGSQGTCKFLKECPTAVQLINTGVNPVLCGYEESKSIVCCKDEEVREASNITTITNQNSRTPGDMSKQKCKEYAEYAYQKISAPTLLLKTTFTKKLVCDIPRNRLIVGSSLASRREFPHMATIGYISEGEAKYRCSGSLISENFVLTTGHCLTIEFLGPAKLVRIGITNKTDLTHMQERTVSELIPHPKYKYPLKYDDIGLLRLSKDVKFDTYVRPACLQTDHFIPHILAISSGWGALSSGGQPGRQSNDLLAIVLEFVSAEKCISTFRLGYTLNEGIADESMVCAGTSKPVMSICQGESGGPLQVYHKETEEVKCMYDIIGVTSFGLPPCGLERDIPEVYVRVSAYVEWIENTVWPK